MGVGKKTQVLPEMGTKFANAISKSVLRLLARCYQRVEV